MRNLQNSMKEALRQAWIDRALSAYTKDLEISNKQCNAYLRALEKQEQAKPWTRKEVTKIRAEISETLKTIQGTNVTIKSWHLIKGSQIGKLSQTNRKKEDPN